MKKIQLLITLKSKFISVNSLYNCRVQYFGGRPRAVMYKNPEANRVEAEIRDQLLAVDFSDYLEWLRNTEHFELNLKFIFKKNASHRDASNAIKSLEDIWTRFVINDLGIDNYDDSKHIRVTSEKALIPGAENEYAILVIKESKLNLRYDILPKPEKIWIDGMEADGVTAFLPPLPKKLKKRERYLVQADHDSADTKIYFLSHNELGGHRIARLYKDIISASSSPGQFVCVGVLSGEWSTEEKETLGWLKNEISELSDGNKNIKMENIQSKEKVLEWIKN